MSIDLRRMPKVELHCHLDGSMGYGVTQKLLQNMGEEWTIDQLKEELSAPIDCDSLATYLKRFELPIRTIQTREGLMASAKDLALTAAAENVKYMEVRFAPVFSKTLGLSVPEIIDSVNKGLKEAEAEADIHTGIIVCGMRHLDMDNNLAMLREARELYGAGVVACDLAGDELAFPTKNYVEFFQEAKRLGMPYTIHSGECGSTENIEVALELGARRIGHGVAMANHPGLIEACAKKRVGVEMCPTSNLQTKALLDFATYPLTKYRKAGVLVSVNTDNRTVSCTDMTGEFERLLTTFPMEEEDLRGIYRDSVEVSFATDDVKHALLKKW
ncbi:MAG: adenosine deaminase [Agathobacter sp.]|nr:adenosine deaminase [Agathobacter sp.]